jgi:Cu-processing system permease protein
VKAMETILSIAKKEVMDNIRSKGIIIVTGIFISLAIVSSILGALIKETGGLEDLKTTVMIMMVFVQYIVPIIGLMLGYATIVGEKERETLSALISYPVTRLEIIIGKFLGLGLVLSASIFIGFGIAGIAIGIGVGFVDVGLYLTFIAFTIILGLVFLSISMAFSSLFKKRSTSMGMSIFTWTFISFLWGMLLFFMIAINQINTSSSEAGGYFILNLFSPAQAFNALISLNIGPGAMAMPSMGMSIWANDFPDFYNNGVLLTLLFLWIFIPLIISYIAFRRRDI